jgi:hypothetical protein
MRNGRVIRVGQIFRVSSDVSDDIREKSYTSLTRGSHRSCADVQKGIWAYKGFRERGQPFDRIPAILLHSNPLKEGSELTPWVDVVEPELGYAIYNGDNRRSLQEPLTARGNSILSKSQLFYSDPTLRKFAPPILLFTQKRLRGTRKGYREFSGYGIPARYMLVSQREKETDRYFTNLVIELVLFRLDHENETFNWAWIDARRESDLDADQVLAFAPFAWKLWVREGAAALERCRRRVARHHVTTPKEQLDYPDGDASLLGEINAYFELQRHAFEGLASLIAQQVIGQQCTRGWVTKRSGDGGVDFVCRLELGSDFSRVPVVVLGQAKCQRSVSGADLARLVARLQRGWIGVFVTTGIFSRNAQEELYEDKYPLVLINGKRLAREVRIQLNSEGIRLQELLDRERGWYEANLQPMEPSRILHEVSFATPVMEKPLSPIGQAAHGD